MFNRLYGSALTSIHDYWKSHNFAIQTFISKVMSLLFKIQSSFVIAFLPRSKHLLISWLQSPSTVILVPKTTKSITVSTVSPSISHEVMTRVVVFKPRDSILIGEEESVSFSGKT